MNSFNSEDTFRAYSIFEPLFIPLGFWDLSYGKFIGYYNRNNIDMALTDMIESYLNYVNSIDRLEDIYTGLISQSIQNSGAEIYLLELLIYISIELGYYNECANYIEAFKVVSNEIDEPWKDAIIQRVDIIVKMFKTGDLQSIHNTLLEWQNFSIKSLKLPTHKKC